MKSSLRPWADLPMKSRRPVKGFVANPVIPKKRALIAAAYPLVLFSLKGNSATLE
jgi:hypothetical protein